MADELLLGLRRGDGAAYREALRRHGDGVYAFLLRLTGRRDVADDLFQETWLALAKSAPSLADDTRIEAWLFTVARNAFRRHHRWRWVDVSRWLVVEDDGLAPSAAPSPEAALEQIEEVRHVEGALARLRPSEREVLLLGAVDGLSPAEVAVVLGLTPEALRQRLSRARKALAAEVLRAQKEGTRR